MRPPAVPGYQLVGYLGGGSVFQVWEAWPDGQAAPVVVKLPRPEAADRPNTPPLLRREARAGFTVRHPRVVRVIRARLAERPPYVVLEYLPGESLKARLERTGNLSARAAVWVARQAAEGLAAVHRAGFVHADVKPGNVLVNDRGEAKLIDLAFAHRPGENRSLHQSGFVTGTANYLAPELCQHPTRDGPAADVFALGVMLFECLTGYRPYRCGPAKEVIGRRPTEEPTDLADVPGDWPDRAVELVRAMLSRDPVERPLAAAVVRELVKVEIELMRATVRT